MADPDADVLMRYVLTGKLFGQTTQTTLWLRSKEGADITDMPSFLLYVLDDMNTWWVPRLKACASTDWELQQAVVDVLAGDNPYQAVKDYVASSGNQSGPSLPPHDAMLLSLYTGFHGRRLHGRLYLPGLAEDQSAAGVVSDAQLILMQQIGGIMASRYGATGSSSQLYMCVFSKANGVTRIPVPTPHLVYLPLAAIPITNVIANREIATQRHRKLRRGI